jgi:antirestriction protein ArdC
MNTEKQHNPISRNIYQGNNQSTLQSVANKNGYKSNKWATYNQLNAVGRRVKKGEKATTIHLGIVENLILQKDKTYKKERVFLGYSKVFNYDQTK